MVETIELETERLRLRQWKSSDRQPFATMSADPDVMAFFFTPLSKAESEAMIDRCQAFIAEIVWGVWAVELKQTGQFIVLDGLHIPSNQLPFAPCVEIVWRIAKAFWNKGYATEAAECALQFGFDRLELDEIVAFTTLANQRSQAVMKKLGMQLMPESFDHPAVPEGHELRRHCLYKLSQTQWKMRHN